MASLASPRTLMGFFPCLHTNKPLGKARVECQLCEGDQFNLVSRATSMRCHLVVAHGSNKQVEAFLTAMDKKGA